MNTKPAPLSSIDEETAGWVVAVANALRNEGLPIRAHESAPCLEVKSLRRDLWMPLNRPTNSPLFDTAEQRDEMLSTIQWEVASGALAAAIASKPKIHAK